MTKKNSTSASLARQGSHAAAVKLLAVAGNIAETITEIRLATPLRALAQRNGWTLRLKSVYQCTCADWLWADVVVIQRAIGERQRRRVAWLRRRGVRVIYDIDDLLTEPAPHLMSTAMLQREADNVRAMLQQVSTISCSTPRLAQRLAALGTPVWLTPNSAPAPLSTCARHDDAHPATVVVAASDFQVVAPLAAALQRLRAEQPALSVVAIGPIAQSLQEHGVTARSLPLMTREAFLATVAALPNPVGAIPLDDSPFSNCKSAIKFFDYTAAGLPCVCSDVPPYSDVVIPGQTGLLCGGDADAWYTALATLCGSAQQRRALVAAAQAQVQRQHGPDQSIAAWQALIGQLLCHMPSRPAPTPLQRLSDAINAVVDPPAVWLRQLNRYRKMRRLTRHQAG